MKKINFQNGVTKVNDETFNTFQSNINEAINELIIPTVKENTVVNQYVKLFKVTMTANYKACQVLFYFSDTQSLGENQVCALTLYRSNTSITVRVLKGVGFYSGTGSLLSAVQIDTNTVEVYYKMRSAMSPTLKILNVMRLQPSDSYGKVEIDMATVVSSLPSGTVTNYAQIGSDVAVATTSTASAGGSNKKITLNTLTKSAKGLSLSNGNLVVGYGIKKIKINASVFLDSATGTGYLWTIVQKNSNNVKGVLTPYAGGSYISSSIPDFILDVAQGDTISLVGDSSVGGTVRTGDGNTWLSAEIVV